jgi:hypothetical protein
MCLLPHLPHTRECGRKPTVETRSDGEEGRPDKLRVCGAHRPRCLASLTGLCLPFRILVAGWLLSVHLAIKKSLVVVDGRDRHKKNLWEFSKSLPLCPLTYLGTLSQKQGQKHGSRSRKNLTCPLTYLRTCALMTKRCFVVDGGDCHKKNSGSSSKNLPPCPLTYLGT